ncbi:alpha/beta fold hydrolase [Nocardia sp. CDC160]|uniref:alpha/beta fold hydrolase n=1 Tax=Nocardia sp. CDC160 TaxID=3112166 RepID=UPI002DC06162|nr:alpha/beta hydrolase [Nocardia sp. CDC160]MEC3917234.1 alpha/beta hydrolase [Nocardia sp. CDC160]
MSAAASRTIALPHCRVSYAEYGAEDGMPVLYCHGVPGTHLEGEAFDEAGAAAGVRVVAVDRPGMAESSLPAGERVADWVDTVVELADRLGFERFGVIGVSGGGPYALAIAARLPERVTGVAVVSAPAPAGEQADAAELDPVARKRRRGLNVLRRIPFLVHPMAMEMSMVIRRQRGVAGLVAQMASVDRERVEGDAELTAKLEENLRRSFEQGSRGFATDIRLVFTRDWGFALTDVTVPVQVWHGDADGNVPADDAHRLAAALPHGRLHIVPGAGHLLFVDRPADILASMGGEQS